MSFQEIFGHQPTLVRSAPGRVNLLGEHTDYNGGFVLPTAIPQETTVSISVSEDGLDHIYSADLQERQDLSRNGQPEGFAKYVQGSVRVLERKASIPPLNIHVSSNVPMGAGLSSSAALEVAVIRAINDLLDLGLNGVDIALLAQQAEHQFAGVMCGIMDQMASSVASTREMLLLDTLTLDRKLIPLPAGFEVLVLDSGAKRRLAESGYNTRRAECEKACEILGIASLRDAQLSDVDRLPDPLNKRARHVITENARVQEALTATAERFGELMNLSHASMRDDYEASHVQVDALVERLQAHQDVLGARITGAGWGGCCVALVKAGTAKQVAADVLQGFNAAGGEGRLVVPE
ncbi:galactokinase [Deinococcus roseus]|uniref:Galactokinase n=1 Tax=Deinococcus roseus TaxID=392414 RepID=A0ABQ2DB18_9DEIO|nr:galactokinase [Deinococcus roseus]GGJ51731.1 galactokinase [Deinococcus roseus]